MLIVNVKSNIADVLREFDLMAADVAKAVPRALNKTARTARAQAAREIKSVGYNIKIAAIKRALTIRKANKSELTAIIRANGKSIPLINYGARQNGTGVTVIVLNGRKAIAHAFIATMKSGHKGVFIRADAKTSLGASRKGFKIERRRSRSTYKHGLPIDELFGPAIPSAFGNAVVQAALEKAVQERFPVVLKQELKFLNS